MRTLVLKITLYITIYVAISSLMLVFIDRSWSQAVAVTCFTGVFIVFMGGSDVGGGSSATTPHRSDDVTTQD